MQTARRKKGQIRTIIYVYNKKNVDNIQIIYMYISNVN
jgi:hypothetical protein